MAAFQQLSMEELVDVLAQKTQKFTQLLVEKKFNGEYQECKETIQQLLAEIELRKEISVSGDEATKPKPAP